MSAGTEALDTAALQALLGPQLTAEQARAVYAQGPEAVVFALLALAKRLAEQQQAASRPDPSAPSGQAPPCVKASAKRRGKAKGARAGHQGHRRAAPARVDRREEHTLPECPSREGPLPRCRSHRTRLIGDVPQDIQPVVTEHAIPRYWCPACAKQVEPVVPDALPGSPIGPRVVVLSAWVHYLLGATPSRIVEVFNFHPHFQLSAGGLVHVWHRLRDLLFAWYVQIQGQALGSAVLHADEAGWRGNGKTHWLVSDFRGAYSAVACADKQKCLPHLLRDRKRAQHCHRPGGDWPAFAKELKRLIRDALRLAKKRRELSAERFARRRQRLEARLDEPLAQPWEQRHARRRLKRLRRHRGEPLTSLGNAAAPSDDSHAERMIRPAVIVRKGSYANASEEGAQTQAVLMGVLRTLKQRGYNPVAVAHDALRTYLRTDQLPPLPALITANG